MNATTLRESVRFAAVSVTGLMVDIGVALAIVRLSMAPLWLAAACGFIVACITNYVAHEAWTFRTGSLQLSAARAAKFGGASVTGLSVRILTITALQPTPLGRHDLLVLISAAAVSFVANFTLSRLVVFSPPTTVGDRQ